MVPPNPCCPQRPRWRSSLPGRCPARASRATPTLSTSSRPATWGCRSRRATAGSRRGGEGEGRAGCCVGFVGAEQGRRRAVQGLQGLFVCVLRVARGVRGDGHAAVGGKPPRRPARLCWPAGAGRGHSVAVPWQLGQHKASRTALRGFIALYELGGWTQSKACCRLLLFLAAGCRWVSTRGGGLWARSSPWTPPSCMR